MAVRRASSITLLPVTRAVIAKPSRMGTPLLTSVASVRANDATATFSMRLPKMGAFNRAASTSRRPPPVRRNHLNPQSAARAATATYRMTALALLLSAMTRRVGAGRAPPKLSNRPAKMGMT